MTRKVTPPKSVGSSKVTPSPEHIRLATKAARVLMMPIVKWLIRSGVSFGVFSESLKRVFIDVAREELAHGGSKTTDSAISVLSGVHRKDVRVLSSTNESSGADPDEPQALPLASQVFTRWLTDPSFRGRGDRAGALPRSGSKRSFDALCSGISTDVHPRTVLEELLRLGLVRVEGDLVTPEARAFVPSRKLDGMTRLFAANIADHAAACAHNLTESGSTYLEQSVWATGLASESVDVLHGEARAIWEQAFQQVVAVAGERVALDADTTAPQRIRLGVYFFSEPERAATPTTPLPVRRTLRKATGKSVAKKRPGGSP